MPASISLIRHAEKQLGDGPPRGVLVDGSPDPESLTPRGWQRAGALVGLFVPRADQSGVTILPTPTRLFASEVGEHSHSRRPLETLLPLSERIGKPLEEPFLQDELDRLVAAIRASDEHILVAWEHKRIPLIANQLVEDRSTVPQVWPDDRFDLVWVFEPDPSSGGLRWRQVPQLLLAGDRAEPIT
jgi:broad specificity phosphatase PhoE